MTRLPSAEIDMYEALPVPFGLVRFGVAPDHPEVKNCQDKFDEIASSPNFRFLGNISIGEANGHAGNCSIPLEALLSSYDAVTFAYGASTDRTLGIPGELLKGVHSAREFVGWYNGLPGYSNLQPDLRTADEAVIIGQGNVALDVARVLLSSVDVLRKTDMTEEALACLSESRVRRVHIVGRRGPMQAAFTIKELRELIKLPNVGFHTVDTSLIPELDTLPRPTKRLMTLLKSGVSTPMANLEKSWSLDFTLSPKEFLANENDPSRVGQTAFEHMNLSAPFDSKARATGTGETITLPSQLVFRSIGYKSSPLKGFEEAGINFDTNRGVLVNDGMGRVERSASDTTQPDSDKTSRHAPGLYCAGWVKRGPTGVIASTMEDAFATGESIVSDWIADAPFLSQGSSTPGGWEAIQQAYDSNIRPCKVVNWQDWRRIDSAEKGRGQRAGKEREKITNTGEMLSTIS